MKFLFAIILCLGNFAWSQEEGVGDALAASMQIGEAASGAKTTADPVVPGIKCEVCEKHAMSVNIHNKGLTSNPAATGAAPGGGDATDGAAER